MVPSAMTTKASTPIISAKSPYSQNPQSKYDCKSFQPQAITHKIYTVDWVNLAIIDLSLFDIPGGKEKLAAQLYHAIKNIGFIYVIDFGLTQEEIDAQDDIAESLFSLPGTEKLPFIVDLDKGEYMGCKPFGLREAKASVPEILKYITFPNLAQEG
jgi:hypothetical protein